MLALIGLFLPALFNAHATSAASCPADRTGAADSTAAFAKCLAAHPSGDLFIPAGHYKISGTITMTRNQSLTGEGSRASVLKCESTTTACIVAADNSGGVNNYSVSNIQDLGIEGPGSGNASIGIFLGGDPSDKLSSKQAFGDSVNLVGVRVARFHHAVEWGNNAYLNKIERTLIFENDVALYAPAGLHNSGEAIGIADSAIFNNKQNGIEDHANFEWMIQSTSFDYNNTAIQFYGATIHAVNCHFEQERAQILFQPSGFANLSIRDSEILIQSPAGSDPYILSTWPQSLNLIVDNVSIWSNHPVRYFMRAQGSISGSVTNLYGNGNRKIGAFSDDPKRPSLQPSEAF